MTHIRMDTVAISEVTHDDELGKWANYMVYAPRGRKWRTRIAPRRYQMTPFEWV
jgi:hypothetical protein